MQVFINFQEQDEPVVEEVVEEEEQWNEHLFSRVEDLELSVRSANCLQNAGISSSINWFNVVNKKCSRPKTSVANH